MQHFMIHNLFTSKESRTNVDSGYPKTNNMPLELFWIKTSM
jgi:hypothetical protein